MGKSIDSRAFWMALLLLVLANAVTLVLHSWILRRFPAVRQNTPGFGD